MKRVLLSHAGGCIGLGFARALKAAPEPFYLIGVDAGKFSLQRAKTDEKYLIPRANDDAFLPVLKAIIDETQPDLLWVQHDAEIAVVSKIAYSLSVPTFLPQADTVAVCQDKMASYHRLHEARVPVPESRLICTEDDLRQAFRELGDEVWLRAIKGTAGNGSLPVSDFHFAKDWIDFHHGWGQFMAAERLTQRSVSWESIWREGQLIAAQGANHLYWEFPGLTLSGVSGVIGASQFMANPVVDETAARAITAVTKKPHGVFTVDMSYDAQGIPKVTEINIGRFMSGGVICCVAPGINAPYLAVQVALGEEPVKEVPLFNLVPQDTVLTHGVDMEPVLWNIQQMEGYAQALQRRRAALDAPAVG